MGIARGRWACGGWLPAIRSWPSILTVPDVGFIKPPRFAEMVARRFGTRHQVRTHLHGSPFANFPRIEVPEGHYLAMGDNRDESADSRAIGFVPRDEIVGRSKSVVLSLNYDNYYIPRADRFFYTL